MHDILGGILGGISQSYAASGQAASAAHANAMQTAHNSQLAYMQNLGAQNALGGPGQNALGNRRLLDGIIDNCHIGSLQESASRDREIVAESVDYAAVVQPSEHELEIMRLDENLAELKKKTAEIHAEVKARVFAKPSTD